MTMRTPGDTIREMRMEKGLAQEQLAQAAGMARPHLANIELGKNKLTGSLAKEGLARAFGMSVEQLGAVIEARKLLPPPPKEPRGTKASARAPLATREPRYRNLAVAVQRAERAGRKFDPAVVAAAEQMALRSDEDPPVDRWLSLLDAQQRMMAAFAAGKPLGAPVVDGVAKPRRR